MITRPPRSTRTTHSFPTRRSSDLWAQVHAQRNAQWFSLKISLPLRPADPLGEPELRHRVCALTLAGKPIVLFPKHTVGEENLRSEEHTSELQSLMRISYAVFCLQKKKDKE